MDRFILGEVPGGLGFLGRKFSFICELTIVILSGVAKRKRRGETTHALGLAQCAIQLATIEPDGRCGMIFGQREYGKELQSFMRILLRNTDCLTRLHPHHCG
jgi:hypothetical protein